MFWKVSKVSVNPDLPRLLFQVHDVSETTGFMLLKERDPVFNSK